MVQYTIRRIILAVPVLFAIVVVVFALTRAIPGDPCKAILGEKASAATCEQFARDYGLDQPIPTQFGIYMKDVLRGDLGDSIRFGRPVSIIMIERLPMTIELGVTSMIIALLVGIPAGILSAVRRNSAIDVVTMIGANIGVSLPVFFLGLLLVYLFAVILKDTPLQLPPSGRLSAGVSPTAFYEVFGWEIAEEGLKFHIYEFISNLYIVNSIITQDWEVLRDVLRHLLLPAVALSTIPLSIIARMTRSSMLEVLGLDYVRTARAKGLPNRKVIFKHALRNALLPVVTIAGLQLGGILSGAVLTETIFGLAGVGLSMFEAITSRDFPIVQGLVIIIAFIYVLFNLLVDLSYAFLDPRIRLD
ncbi:MAG: ABC transporter permease [Chloroflexi bacterium]|nr:ABC transporter permease [Chloroflexota bacterium]